MGYLDNTSVTVDAILTKKGREYLASGRGNFQITKFALGDDEVDYTLWNTAHSLGSDYYGEIIENMPVLEAITDENFALRYKLLTLDKSETSVPIFSVTPASINLPQRSVLPTGAGSVIFTISGTRQQQYTVTLLDDRLGTINVITANTFEFVATPTLVPQTTQSTKIIVVGNTTGGRVDINVTVTPNVTATTTQATTVRGI
jgi:hypothetical protein